MFKALGSKEKLIATGNLCLEQGKYPYASQAFELVGDKDLLNKLGDTLLREGLFTTAEIAYKAAHNEMMVEFIKSNFEGRRSLLE